MAPHSCMLTIFLEVYHQIVYILQISNITENVCIIEILCEGFILCGVHRKKINIYYIVSQLNVLNI